MVRVVSLFFFVFFFKLQKVQLEVENYRENSKRRGKVGRGRD